MTSFNIVVAGIGTGVGKTVVSAILSLIFKGDYWKPIECGHGIHSDTTLVSEWLQGSGVTIHPPTYALKAPVSPHHAARLEGKTINCDGVTIPSTSRPLIIEGVGGVLVPISSHLLTVDLFQAWPCVWVIVSHHYLGSINHTLLTIEGLRQRRLPLLGLIFNGDPHPDTESAICAHTHLPVLGRLLPESSITLSILKRYAAEWTPQFSSLLPLS